MKVLIKPITKKNVKEAINIAVAATVGERPEVEKDMFKNLTEKTNRYFAAYCGQEMVGEIGWYQDKEGFAKKALGDIFPEGEDVFWVAYFSIKPSFRSKGIGRILMKKIETEVKNNGCRKLWVYTLRARVFYEKCGFKFVQQGFIEDCWQNFLKKSF
jgi:GNAT superfamily N-acetyltransferase